MNHTIQNTNETFLLEDFDIIRLSELNPDRLVGVNINKIFLFISKYNDNPKRKSELNILKNILNDLYKEGNKKTPMYTPMTINDVIICFGDYINSLPKSTFINL